MSYLKYLLFLCLFFITAANKAQEADWNSSLIVPNNPSPYYSDWETNPSNLTFILQYLGQGGAQVYLKFSIEAEKYGGEIAYGESETIAFERGPEQKNLFGSSIIDWNATSWDTQIESIVLRTGRFPEGNYTICVGAYNLSDNLLTESCRDFTIQYIDPPYLISPLDEDTVYIAYPNFIWSPVVDIRSNQKIHYAIRISEKKQNQTKENAISENTPYYDGETDFTTLSYPPTAQELDKNKSYVWQVQALDENDYPVASNNGKSPIWTFTYSDAIISPQLSLEVDVKLDSILFYPGHLNNSGKVDVTCNGTTGEIVVVDSLARYWYKKGDNSLFTTEKDIAVPEFSIMTGEKLEKTEQFNISPMWFSMLLGANQRAEFSIYFEYSGKDSKGKRIRGKSKTPVKVICRANVPSTFSVAFTDSAIAFSPSVLQNTINDEILYQAGSAATLTLDSLIAYWYRKEDNSLYKMTAQELTTSLSLTAGVKTPNKTNLTLDAASVATALGGKSKAEYYLKFKYIGKDDKGNRVTGESKNKLKVVFNAGSNSPLNVAFTDSVIAYSPSVLQHIINDEILYQAGNDKTLTLDSLTAYWYKKEDNSLYKTTAQELTPHLSFAGGVKTKNQTNLSLNVTSFTTALGGKSKAEYYLKFKYIGKDDKGNHITGESKNKLRVVFNLGDKQLLNVVFLDSTLTYSPSHLSNQVRTEAEYLGGTNEKVTLDTLINYWYKKEDNSLFKTMREELSAHPYINGGGKITHVSTFAFPSSAITTALNGKQRAEYYVNIKYIGRDDGGNRVTGETKEALNIVFRANTKPGLNVEFSDSAITYSPSHLSNNANLYLFYQEDAGKTVTIDSFINYWYKKSDSSLFKTLPLGVSPSFQITGGNTFTRTAQLSFSAASLATALGGKKKAEYFVNIEYIGEDGAGNRVTGKTKTPLNVVCTDGSLGMPDTSGFPLIPKVAYIKPVQGQTTIQSSGNKIIFDGTVKLLFAVDPLKNDSAYVDAVNLTFVKENKGYKVTGGTFLGENAPGAEDDLFNFEFAKVLKVQVERISYDFNRANKLLIKKAFAKVPVIGKKIFFKDLVIDKNGLDFKISQQEFTAFGLVFIVKNIKKSSNSTISKMSLGIGLRLNNPGSKEFFSSELLITKVSGGETTVELKGGGGNGQPLVRLIPTTDYLNWTSLKFIKKPSGNWALKVGVTSDKLPLYDKLGLGPIKTTFEYEKSGKMSGGVVFINETQHGYDKNDKSVFEIGSFAAIDLTYLGFQIEQVQKITTVDSKPDTSWAFDFSKSKIGISADLYLASEGKALNNLSNAIYIGEVNNPGITIDFSGNVKTQTISISKKRRVALGPVYLELTKLGIKPYPFEVAFTGSFGVSMKDVFTGGISIEGLKVDGDGNFTNFGDAVKGGDLSILKVLDLSVKKIQFSKTQATIGYSKSTGTKAESVSLKVDSYFLLEGAKLSVGSSGVAGGSLKRLLIYEKSGATSFILNEGKLSVKDAIDLTIDVEYLNTPSEKYLSVGGKAVVINKYKATVYGKIGERDGDATWGFFVSLGGLDIPIGPVTLDEVGGGFFYRPTKADIRKVTMLAGFTQIKLSGYETNAKPKAQGSQAWAIFLKAGIYVGGKEFIYGKALVTITDSYFKLDAEVKAISGKVHGKAYLNINWAQEYVEGKFQFGVDFVVITAKEKDNYFQFYAYSKSVWGVNGKVDLKCFYIKVAAEFYVGNQGFLFDFSLEESVDIYVISGGFKIEAMVWWRKDVNWGVYGSGKAWGELLGGLIGGEVGIEGALVSPPFLIYLSGHLKIEILWIDVFDGRAWITIGEDGIDGGTGSNSKFDKLIKDARNVGKQMKKDMDDLEKQLQKTRDALYKLSQSQRTAAGNAMLQLSSWAGGSGIGAFFGIMYKNWHERDLYCKLFPYEQIDPATKASGEAWLKSSFDLVWNSKAAKLYQIKTQLEADSLAIENAINEIQSLESGLSSLLNSQSELIEGELPTRTALNSLQSPVTKPVQTVSTIMINDTAKTVIKFDYNLDGSKANSLKNEVANRKKDLEEYQKKLVSMVGDFANKLNQIKQILSGGTVSVEAIANKYAETYDKISSYTTRFVDYLQAENYWAVNQLNTLNNIQSLIFSDLSLQVLRAQLGGSERFEKLCRQRIDLIKSLIKIGAAENFAPPLENISAANFVALGAELYYYIPKAGYSSLIKKTQAAREQFMKNAKRNNDLYQAKWSLFTLNSDKVYSREAKLYTILYDLFDQLSLEAGTRKIQSASSGTVLAGAGSGRVASTGGMPFVYPSGIVGVFSSGAGSSNTTPAGIFQAGDNSFAQIVSSAVNASTGNNIARNQTSNGMIIKTADWAKGWDFEKERKYVKRILAVPKITQFSGNAYSDKNTPSYSKVTLSWSGQHPVGIAEYSFSIEGYSDPVSIGDLSAPPTSGSGGGADASGGTLIFSGQLGVSPTFNQALLGFAGISGGGDNTVDISTDEGPNTVDPNLLGLGGPVQAWRTVGKKQSMTFPFLRGIHKEGSYNIWLRVRGAGGYTIKRAGTINVEYCGNASESSDFDWSTRTSSLASTDNTPPSTPSVTDGGTTTSSLNTLIIKWTAVDYESGIQEYQYKVAYDDGNRIYKDVTPWISAGGQTEMSIRLDKQLLPGYKYYVLVKALNGAGLWSKTGYSDGIQLKDPTPPTKPSFAPTGRNTGGMTKTITLNDSLLAGGWYPASDLESGVIGYLFALGTSEGASDVINWCAVQSTNLNLDKIQLNKLLKVKLQKGTAYYFSVKAMNGIGIVGKAVSKTVTAN